MSTPGEEITNSTEEITNSTEGDYKLDMKEITDSMVERSLVLDIEFAVIYRQKILRMLDTFVSLMYCSHLSIKFMLGEKGRI